MELLNKEVILASLSSIDCDTLFIDPLLEEDQIGEVTIDLRLGYDFLVSTITRKPSIELSPVKQDQRGVSSFFQETRRDLGDKFVLYPHQVALSTTMEYLSLPSNIYADVLSRSSYTRLGIHINTMVQPGFRGCIPLELYNHGNNAIELVVGSKLPQIRLFELPENHKYHKSTESRKYFGDVRPVISRVEKDKDFEILSKIQKSHKF